MKLNPDCVRDVLLAVEENTGVHAVMEIDEDDYTQYQQLKKYKYEEVAYHIVQCKLNGYFTDFAERIDNSYMIVDLSPKAHEFIANIRSDTNWKKIKEKALTIGSFSLSVLADIAKKIILSQF